MKITVTPFRNQSQALSEQTASAQPQPRVAIYARSSAKENGESYCDHQIEELHRYASGKGWDIVNTISDIRHNASTLYRPGFEQLRSLVLNGEVDAIVCTSLDRLSRDKDILSELREEFQSHNVVLLTSRNPIGEALQWPLLPLQWFDGQYSDFHSNN